MSIRDRARLQARHGVDVTRNVPIDRHGASAHVSLFDRDPWCKDLSRCAAAGALR